MPIIIPQDIPAYQTLSKENIFVGTPEEYKKREEEMYARVDI